WTSDMLGVNTLSRELAHHVLHGRGSWIPVPHWYRAVTAAWMPERLREEFALAYGKREEAAVVQAQRWLPRIYTKIPAAFRFVGPYHEASTRLLGRQPGLVTRANNRFWMGQSRMMFAEGDS
ncbi:MAG TPA: hypothetical protein VGM27_32920, partial [Acidobacteriaceae bacterium]